METAAGFVQTGTLSAKQSTKELKGKSGKARQREPKSQVRVIKAKGLWAIRQPRTGVRNNRKQHS